ncbi:MAG: 2-succinyl-5-enolpyruvyl-6-hydroxy-3-cyclohexene-1-carboxylic-acid synthase [Micrococcales bacterium]|nr:2-succinyl-5-enolpyruvyl-6-hydroxy-3-cyclohexene-1-carboxylic-acid synthase [Micrococcales bacterium]
MSPDRTASALAGALIRDLYAAGLRDVVLSPGSRSAPLALALHAADRAGDLRLHVRVDERSAAFVALGLATGSRLPVAVVTTSGTAVGNLMPAVMEAHHSGRRLIVISADRPDRLRDSGANQTTRQAGLFGTFAPCHDLTPDAGRTQIEAAVAAAWSAAGPTQINVQFDGDLLPAGGPDTWWTDSPDSATGDDRRPPDWWPQARADGPAAAERAPEVVPNGPRTVVVAGDDAGPAARLLAEAGNWPLLAEPTSGARTGRHAIRTYRLLLGTALRDDIERVIVAGHPTLSRPVTGLIADPALEVLAVRGRHRIATDPGRTARHVDSMPDVARPDGPAWLDRWRTADLAVGSRLDESLSGKALTPLSVAAVIGAAVGPGTSLVVGSSNPVRDLDIMAIPWPSQEHRFVAGNRGLAGIDGMVSTAIGVALGRARATRTIAYLGDLTFLHDVNGLLLPHGERRPPLTFVVQNDDGGSVFATLEQGDVRYASAFEHVFGTPHGTDLEALCRAHHTAYERITDIERLTAALAEAPSGIRVLEVPVSRRDRSVEAQWLVRLAGAVGSAPTPR